MKVIAAFFAVLVASTSAIPQSSKAVGLSNKQQRLVTNVISSAIEDISQTIKKAGLDPLNIEREEVDFALAVPSIFSASAFAENVQSNGLSNIIINRLSFAVLTTRLTFDIELPQIEASVGKSGAEASFFGAELEGQVSGRIAVSRIRVSGQVRVSVGIFSGISIRDLSLDFTLGGIKSELNVVIQGSDVSEPLNDFLSVRIPRALNEYRSDLNELLEIVLLDILDDVL